MQMELRFWIDRMVPQKFDVIRLPSKNDTINPLVDVDVDVRDVQFGTAKKKHQILQSRVDHVQVSKCFIHTHKDDRPNLHFVIFKDKDFK